MPADIEFIKMDRGQATVKVFLDGDKDAFTFVMHEGEILNIGIMQEDKERLMAGVFTAEQIEKFGWRLE
jgi:hypothetical protein